MQPPFVRPGSLTWAALDWAAQRHGDQLRDLDCAPYILHPLEVAALLHGRGLRENVVAAGLLHDVVEDTHADATEVAREFGEHVAQLVAAVTEDASIPGYRERKAALREQVAEAGPEAHAIYAADKVVKARELRAEASRAAEGLEREDFRRRLEHYEASLEMLEGVTHDLPLVRQLAFELWALRHLPPRPAAERG